MVICLSGRKSSGKTTLSELLVNKGFIKISFADPMKKYISILYGIDIKDFYDVEKKECLFDIPLTWNKFYCDSLSKIIGEVIEFKEETKLISIRHAMQYIGTQVLRNYDENFHVKKMIESLDPTKNYVCDDGRFKNEIDFMKSCGAICVFIIRPNFFEYSNHDSEIGVNFTDFEYVIINDSTVKKLSNRFMFFVNWLMCKKVSDISRDNMFNLLKSNNFNTSIVANILGKSKSTIAWWCKRLLINIEKNKYVFDNTAFLKLDETSAYLGGVLSADGCIKRNGNSKSYIIDLSMNDMEPIILLKQYMKSNKPIYKRVSKINNKITYSFVCTSNYILDNLKLWNLKPKKSRFNSVPDCIRNNRHLLDYQVVGLIDGDGCINVSKNGLISLYLIASEEIVDFVKDLYGDIISHKSSEKGITNLYKLQFNGKYAVNLYDRLGKATNLGLDRKWNKFKETMN